MSIVQIERQEPPFVVELRGLDRLRIVSMEILARLALDEDRIGTVRIEVVKAGFIVGVGGGRGTLVFQGRRYPLSVGGLSFGATIGASKADLIGRAYNLRRASDIAGTYTAVGGGVAVGGGASGIRLQNARGVVLELRGRNVGLEFNANVSGVEIGLR
jgi:hypothetical protein